MTKHSNHSRWTVAVAAVLLQLVLGTVHAWSIFRQPLCDATGWSTSQITLAYTLAILLLGCSAPLGGLALGRFGPRRVGCIAGLLYGIGTLVAGLAGGQLLLLYLGYSFIGGIGLGLGFVVPVATVVRWFPDKRGRLSGIAVAGFGAGALVAAPVATWLIARIGISATLTLLGLVYLVVAVGAAWFLRQAPENFRPAGWQESESASALNTRIQFSARDALGTWQWHALWTLLFLNVSAGSAILSQAATMAQVVAGADTLGAAALVGPAQPIHELTTQIFSHTTGPLEGHSDGIASYTSLTVSGSGQYCTAAGRAGHAHSCSARP